MIVLDTDAFTLMTHGDPRFGGRVSVLAEPLAITLITRIEVLRGRFSGIMTAADGSQLQTACERLARSEEAMSQIEILPMTGHAAAEFGRLVASRGVRKIGRADLLIASIVLSEKATLVTRNLRHFREVPGLRIEDWTRS